MRAMTCLLVTAAMLCGCTTHAARDPVAAPAATSPEQSTPSNLEGTDWRFVDVAGTSVPDGVTATLHLRRGRASGKAGCNGYGASWEMSTDGRIRFGATMSTKMACIAPAGAMQVEQGVFEALRGAATVRRDGTTLVLLDASGKPLAKLVADGVP